MAAVMCPKEDMDADNWCHSESQLWQKGNDWFTGISVTTAAFHDLHR